MRSLLRRPPYSPYDDVIQSESYILLLFHYYAIYHIRQGPRSKFSTGGAKGKRVSVSHLGGSGGLLPPENFDINSSKMTGSSCKNNK